MQRFIHTICHAHIRVRLSRSAGGVVVTVRPVVCFLYLYIFIYFFYVYVSLVSSCVQIQCDALSTKGVKINVVFTFILTVT